MFNVSKTTLIGIVALLAGIAKIFFGVEIPNDVQQSLIVVLIFLLGIFAQDQSSDKNKR
jgi:uncharacterized membrane protein